MLAGIFYERLRAILNAHNVGGAEYADADALFDIKQAFTETFGPIERVKGN